MPSKDEERDARVDQVMRDYGSVVKPPPNPFAAAERLKMAFFICAPLGAGLIVRFQRDATWLEAVAAAGVVFIFLLIGEALS